MLKRILSLLMAVVLLVTALPAAALAYEAEDMAEVSNPYIRVTVNKNNGGYVIATTGGDILNKSDDNVNLLHRGNNMDSSFTSFRVGEDGSSKDYIFGNDYGFLGMNTTPVETEVNSAEGWIKSSWSVDDGGSKLAVEQKITLIASEASEQLGTAEISYTVKNNSGKALPIKGRVLMDTQLGDQDYGFYELPRQYLGQGYEYFSYERSWDQATSTDNNPMPADYFVRDRVDQSRIVAYGVNSVFKDQKPYRMTFAHWANIAATKFDYQPDNGLYFTNDVNSHRTADSAVALYYDLGSIPSSGSRTFATHYGVTANLKNKDNQILINTTAPSRLEFTDDSRTAFKSSDPGALGDNIIRINTTVTNPVSATKSYKHLRAVVYAMGLTPQRRTDQGSWTAFNNADPIFVDIKDEMTPGSHKVTYFDLMFTPKEAAELGSILIKVYNMDPAVNADGAYAENYCLGTTENFIIIPGQNKNLPAISLSTAEPEILYNDETRYLTVHGQGVTFFKSDLLNKVTLVREDGQFSYDLPDSSVKNILYGQPEKKGDPITTATFQLQDYMEPGKYQLHFHWRKDKAPGAGEEALQGVPEDFTSPGMVVTMSNDPIYRNEHYGLVAVLRDGKTAYKTMAFKSETELNKIMGTDSRLGQIPPEDFLLICRGPLMKSTKAPGDTSKDAVYHLAGNDKNITINNVINCFGSDFSIQDDGNGSVTVSMDGKITSLGANTTLRNGTAAFFLKKGIEYLIPVFDENGNPVENAEIEHNGQNLLALKWDNAFDLATYIGGFLIDLRFGVMGKIKNNDGTLSDVMSFGGALDLSFVTPGGAKNSRINKAAETKGKEWVCIDPRRAPIGTKAGENGNHVKDEYSYSGYAHISNILYGGQDPGYLGINMETYAHVPQLIPLLPTLDLGLAVNTIGGYEVGFDGKAELAKLTGLEFAVSIVVKGAPNGAPIPDKLVLQVDGLEPGINIDTVGGIWITGAGGGVDNLYDTVFCKDGLPPLSLMFHVSFDLAKIVSGSADLELSLRSISISADDLRLKALPKVKFLDEASIALQWLPSFSLTGAANINFLSVMKGQFYVSFSAGYSSDVQAFLEFMFRVGLYIPKGIPVVGGAEIASAELGGGTEKLWGNVSLLDTIKVGFLYYWGSDVEFVLGGVGGSSSIPTLAGGGASAQLFSSMSEPTEITAPGASQPQYMTVGSNLSYMAGSKIVSGFDDLCKNGGPTLMGSTATTVYTNTDRSQHLVTLGQGGDYILNIARVDGQELTREELSKALAVTRNGKSYSLKYYVAPAHDAPNAEKEQALATSNVNVSGGGAYLIIPAKDAAPGTNFLLKFSDAVKYDVGAVMVNPISELTGVNAVLNGSQLQVTWTGTNITDTASVIVAIAPEQGSDTGAELYRGKAAYTGNQGSVTLDLPADLAGGEYYVTVTLSDEGTCYQQEEVKTPFRFVDNLAPAAPAAVTLSNCGNYKLKLDVTPPTDQSRLSGYYVDVYEEKNGEPVLVNAGLYFDKDAPIMYVGGRFDRQYPVQAVDKDGFPMKGADGKPLYVQAKGEDGKLLFDKDGKPVPETRTETVGFNPGSTYSVKVRSVYLEDVNPEIQGDELSHYSGFTDSTGVKLNTPKLPNIKLGYDRQAGKLTVSSDIPVTGELYVNANTSDRSWFEFPKAGTALLADADLPDGEYLLEFHGQNEQLDKVMVQETITLDTTPPSLLMDSPISGASFTGRTIPVKLDASEKAVYTAKINGVTAPVTSKNTGGLTNSGLVELDVAIPEALANKMDLTLELTATDAKGNKTVKTILLVNQDISSIREVELLVNGKAVPEGGEIRMEKGSTAKVTLQGILSSGRTIDITNLPNASVTVFSGSGAVLKNGTLTASEAGKTTIAGTLALGTGLVPLMDGFTVLSSSSVDFSTTGVTVSSVPAGTVNCIAAGYSGGQMIAYSAAKVGSTPFTVSFPEPVPAGTDIRVFFLDEHFVPLRSCERGKAR